MISDVGTDGKITLLKSPRYGIISGMRYYVFNSPSKLDIPGEYYIDTDKKMLYYYPNVDIEQAEFELTFCRDDLVSVNSAADLAIEDIVFEGSRLSGISAYENLFENCDMAILTGGVHDNGFYDNVLINCKKSIQYDASAKKGGWAEALVLTDGGVYESFQTFIESGVNTELWCKTFPGFSELFEKFKIKQKYYSDLASGATDLKDVDLGIPTNAKIYGNSHYGEYILNDNYYDVCDDVLKSADVKLDDEIKSKTLPESIEKSGYGSTDTEVP